MKKIKNGYFTGERALFSECGAEILSSVFENGESPLKESRDIYLENCINGNCHKNNQNWNGNDFQRLFPTVKNL